MVARLTKEQAAIVGAFTGVVAGPFGDVHEYAELKLGRPLFTHELALRADEIRAAAKEDYLALCYEAPAVDG